MDEIISLLIPFHLWDIFHGRYHGVNGVLNYIWYISFNLFFCLTIQRILFRVSPENRKIKPVFACLIFIPIVFWFGLLYIIKLLSDSIASELAQRGLTAQAPIAPPWGIYYGLSVLLYWVLCELIDHTPFLERFVFLEFRAWTVTLFFFILYYRQLIIYKRMFKKAV